MLAVIVAVVGGTSACDSKPTHTSSYKGCPKGTKLVDGKHCVADVASMCPEGFEYDEKKKACNFPCPDASVDAELPWLCQPEDSGPAEAGL